MFIRNLLLMLSTLSLTPLYAADSPPAGQTETPAPQSPVASDQATTPGNRTAMVTPPTTSETAKERPRRRRRRVNDPHGEVSHQATTTWMMKLKLVKETGEAAFAARRFIRSMVDLGEAFFVDGGAYRNGKAYQEDYGHAVIIDKNEIRRLQTSKAKRLQRELRILKEDATAFMASELVKAAAQDFSDEHRQMMKEFKDVADMSDGFPMLASLVLSHEDMNRGAVENLVKRVNEGYQEMIDEKGQLSEKSLLAAIYLLTSIFYNNGTRFALLYDNPVIIAEMSQWLEKEYGGSPLLRFAADVAPAIDSANRQLHIFSFARVRDFIRNHSWSAAGGGMALVTFATWCVRRYWGAARGT